MWGSQDHFIVLIFDGIQKCLTLKLVHQSLLPQQTFKILIGVIVTQNPMASITVNEIKYHNSDLLAKPMQESRLRATTTNAAISLPSCPGCSKPYDMYYHIPRVLPKCGHTFCQKCIKNKLINKKGRFTFTCGVCDSDVIVRKSVEDQLPKNVTIIDIIKDSKYRNIEQQDSNSKDPTQPVCEQHGKKLQMICVTCKNIKICPHCAIFGTHKGHNITNEQAATGEDMKQLRQFLSVIEDTVQQYLLPHSVQNLQIKSKDKLTSSLQQYVKQSFKTYYLQLSRRQAELLEQCQNINLDQKAGQYLDNILTSYDILKIKGSQVSSQVSRAEVEAVIDRAKQLHREIQTIVESYDKSVQGFLQTAKIKIKQTIFFDVRLLDARNLKAILKSNGSPQFKKKQSNLRHSINNQPKTQYQDTKKSQLGSIINRINTQQSTFSDKNQLKAHKIINASTNSNKQSMIVNSRVKMERPITTRDKPQQEQERQKPIIKEVKKYHSVIESDAPQIPAFKNVVNNKLANSKLASGNSKRGEKTPDKQKQKIERVRSRERSPINEINLNEKVQLKFTKPTRQMNYELKTKFQTIVSEIDRQHPEGTLQLIGMQVSDQMIPYICEYLLNKKLQFSMLKLVKNNITDEGFRILLSYLINDTYTKVLNVTSNHLTQKSLTYILALIGHNNILKTIYISNNKINSMQLKRVQKELESKLVQVVL